MPKLPEMPMFTMPDNLAPPTFDLAPPTMKSQTTDTALDFDQTTEYFFKPAFTSLPDYSDENVLRTEFKPLRDFNLKVDISGFKTVDSSFFIIRSNNIDDIHKVGLLVY